MSPPASLSININSRTRLFPEHPLSSEHHTPLSILDNTVSGFHASAAFWLFEAPSPSSSSPTEPLAHALRITLTSYPHLCGQLRYGPSLVKAKDHTQRFKRIAISYGLKSDPGVEYIVAQSPLRLDETGIPTLQERQAGNGVWEAGSVPSGELYSSQPSLALHDQRECEGLPCLVVQVTLFACGGVGISLKMAHVLADAQGFLTFVRDWANVHRNLIQNKAIPTLDRPFDPSLLDRQAAGNIDGESADPALTKTSRSLPINRFDLWFSKDDAPGWMEKATQVPQEFTQAGIEVKCDGEKLPWSIWDMSLPVSHFLVYFSADEVEGMWKEGVSKTGGHKISTQVSHLDTLIAHVWAVVNRARENENSDDPVGMTSVVGVRERLAHPLPSTFLGSPLLVVRVVQPGSQASTNQGTAYAIRNAIEQIEPTALAAHLHDLAYETSSQRFWVSCFGRRGCIVTSWIRQDPFFDFFGGAPLRYVEPNMPRVDGCIQITEAMATQPGQKWWDNGVVVSLDLATVTMQKLLADPTLRKFKK